jgi:uroporphyrinogen III methyltransferase/synthase
VTHRDFNSSFTLITGHEKEEQYKEDDARARGAATGSSDLDWSAIARLPCVAFYMGVKSLPRISAKLIENGMSPDTPAATIQWGTTPRQRTCVATIGTIADEVQRQHITAPAITIVGKVVSMRDTLNWFETRPLFGQTIVVTRTRDQASELSARLEALGANVLEAPTIETTVVSDWTQVDAELRAIGNREPSPLWGAGRVGAPSVGTLPAHSGDALRGDAAATRSNPSPYPLPAGAGDLNTTVVFTSANGVRAVRERLKALSLDARVFARAQIAVIGDATAQAVRDLLCIEPDVIPKRFVAEALADELVARDAVKGRHFVLFRAEIARPILVDRLRAAGAASVADVAVYATRNVDALPDNVSSAFAGHSIHWITFTSSSTAKNLVALLGEGYRDKLAGVKIASIGAITTETLRTLGLTPTVEATEASMESLAEAIRAHVAAK